MDNYRISLQFATAAYSGSWQSGWSSPSKDMKVVASHGVVATDDERCSRIGLDALREGGHAVDASVAASLCLGVVGLASSGMGGGSFMMILLANGEAQAFDMRETAPMKASEDMYAGNATKKAKGALSIAVPGELAGLHRAWRKYGRLPWKRLVKPAEQLAFKGFKISPYLHMQMVKTESGILADKGLRDLLTSNGPTFATRRYLPQQETSTHTQNDIKTWQRGLL
ncbi:hypothetical protein OIU77_016307 [Salix suchowensis]|uniref:Gamma-glutamyltranspeptidase 1 n=1 Tax=Salix suchowensis TaxID=1278906 RepID=A0ABQ8ZK17_9ROSI|nr:hypothetical protein OIU77_016307 [Salix suchowensis]